MLPVPPPEIPVPLLIVTDDSLLLAVLKAACAVVVAELAVLKALFA